MLISAIMVTGKAGKRRSMAQVAVRCFLEQTYRNRELVIVNDGEPLPVGDDDLCVREVMVNFSPRTTLGDLRNIGLEAARGELVIQWDDDDWHHPQRIAVQAAHWSEEAAVLLRRQLRYSIPSETACVHERPGGIHGTILHRKRGAIAYPSARKQEDSWFLQQFRTVKVVDAPATVYVRFFHGHNTWDEYHVMGPLADPGNKGRWEVTAEEESALRLIFEEYYRGVFSWPEERTE